MRIVSDLVVDLVTFLLAIGGLLEVCTSDAPHDAFVGIALILLSCALVLGQIREEVRASRSSVEIVASRRRP
ncbi:hypothetical protein [Nocardioides montaniterrae]